MGMEFGLYANRSKEFIWLGKSSDDGFQMKPSVISEFLAHHLGDTFSIHADNFPLPDESEYGWNQVGHWNDPEEV